MPHVTDRMPDLSYMCLDSSRYQLLNPLGAGAYGVVYRARERIPYSTQTVMRAIKVMPYISRPSRAAVGQMREVSLHKLVSGHPNVVTLHRVFRDRQFVYVVMDYCTGGDLYKALQKKRPFARNDALVKNIFLQILDGVEGCHAKNVFHRDLKPENIMLNEHLTKAWIGDFGLATALTTSVSFNTGSRYYMSPECIDCDDALYPYDTRRSDIWALGVILLHIVTGRVPWHKATIDDPCFLAFLEHPNFLRDVFPISTALNNLLRGIFTIVPDDALSIAEIRRCVRNMESFWMTKEEVESATAHAKCMWEAYCPLSDSGQAASWSWGASSSSSSEWEGDTLESDTESESESSKKTDERMPELQGATTRSLAMAEEGCVGDVMDVPTQSHSPSSPQVVAQPEARSEVRTCSSDEFPIRAPKARRACELGTTMPPASDSPGTGNGPYASSDSGSSGSSDAGPATPETRPQDPPDVVIAEPLDQPAPEVPAVGKKAVENSQPVLLPSFSQKGHLDFGKAISGSARIGRFLRQFVSSRRSAGQMTAGNTMV